MVSVRSIRVNLAVSGLNQPIVLVSSAKTFYATHQISFMQDMRFSDAAKKSLGIVVLWPRVAVRSVTECCPEDLVGQPSVAVGVVDRP